MILIFLFLGHSILIYANSESEKPNIPSELEIKENYFEYISKYPDKIKKLTQAKDWKQIAEEICNVCYCFFQLKMYDDLRSTIKIATPFLKLYDVQRYYYIKTLEQRLLNDFGKYNKCITGLKLLLKKVNNIHSQNAIYLVLANSYYQLDEIESSRNIYEKILQNQPNFLQKAQAYNGIGSCCYMNSNLDSAAYFYEKGLEILKQNKCNQHSRTAQLIMNLGHIDKENGNYEEATLKYKTTLYIFQRTYRKYDTRIAELYGVLGGILIMQENYDLSSLYLTKEKDILDIFFDEKNPSLVKNYLNQSLVAFYINDLIVAKKYIAIAMQVIKKNYVESHYLNIFAKTTLANIYYSQNKINEAKQLLEKIIAIKLKSKSTDEYLGDAYCLLADCLLKQNKLDDAVIYYNKATEIYNAIYGAKNVYSIDALIGLSNTFIQKNEFKKALEFANQATDCTIKNKQVVYFYDHWQSQLQVLICKNELFKSNQCNESVDAIIEQIKAASSEAIKIKNTFISINNQLHYAEKISALNKLGVYFLMHSKQSNQQKLMNNLLFFIENDRANVLRNNILSIKSSSLLPDNYKNEEASLKSKLNYFTVLRENSNDEAVMHFSINDSILYYSNKYELFINHLEKVFPNLYKYKYAQKSITAAEIQHYLSSNDEFLEYFNDGENYYCLKITKNKTEVLTCGNKKDIDSNINVLSASIQDKKYNYDVAAILGNKLIHSTKENTNWIIAADDMLNTISFDALMHTNNCVKPNYFLYHHSIQYTFSAAIFCNRNTSNKQQIQLFCPDFKNSDYAELQTKKEKETILTFKNAFAYNGIPATRNNFIKQTSKAKVVHIATHLVVDTINPLKSTLIFQPSSTQAYTLSIDNIKKLKLNAQLITLAACKSSFGKNNFGEGLLNFSWSFYFAGAHNILTTRWNAADKTTDNIIADFYLFLKEGKTKSQAIQLAKIKYLETADAIGAQPFFWANFALNGDASAININTSSMQKYWWISFVVLLFFMVINIQLKRKM